MARQADRRRVAVILAACLLTALAALWSPSIVGAQTARQVAERIFPSVVLIVMEDAKVQPLALGSGFFVRGDVVATNMHLLRGSAGGYVRIVGRPAKHEILGVVAHDDDRDLALLKVTGVSAPPVSLGDSSLVAVGDQIYAVGNPQGLEGTFSQGIVSGIRQVRSGRVFQITAPISPGSSGGPVLTANGEVIAIAVATFSGGQNLNFAIPASYLEKLLRETRAPLPLSRASMPKADNSLLPELGGRRTGGVIASHFRWDPLLLSDFSFSLRNQLRHTVSYVSWIAVFYDARGKPVHSIDGVTSEEISPGLAKRVVAGDRGAAEIRDLTQRVEIRILDFRIKD